MPLFTAGKHSAGIASLLAGLRLGVGDGPVDRAALSRVADWRPVARLASRHRVAGLFLRALRSHRIRVPDDAVDRALEAKARRTVGRGMRQLDAMERATAALAARGVPVLVLKGLPLGRRLYGTPFAKSSADIDLLVPPEAFADAGRVLSDLGWRRSLPDFPATPARTRWCDGVLDEHVFVGPGGKLDLHRNLLGNPFLFDPPFAELAANAVTVDVAGRGFRTLGDAHQLPYLACHGSLHGWERLKWLCDFAMLVRSMGDDAVERAAARGRDRGLTAAVAPALLLARLALHVPIPLAAADARPARVRTGLVVAVSQLAWTRRPGIGRIARQAAVRAARFLVGRGPRHAGYELRGLLIRPQDFAQVDLPDRLFWLYVPLRPLLWLRRVLRGEA